jgi:hypothetical protein
VDANKAIQLGQRCTQAKAKRPWPLMDQHLKLISAHLVRELTQQGLAMQPLLRSQRRHLTPTHGSGVAIAQPQQPTAPLGHHTSGGPQRLQERKTEGTHLKLKRHPNGHNGARAKPRASPNPFQA